MRKIRLIRPNPHENTEKHPRKCPYFLLPHPCRHAIMTLENRSYGKTAGILVFPLLRPTKEAAAWEK